MKNLSPIKKMIIGLVAGCIIISIMTANNLASVMMLVAARNTARNNAQTQTVQQGTVQQGTVQQGTVQQGTAQDNGGSSDASANTQTNDTNKESADKGSSTGSQKSVAEICTMYNKAINNAKTKSSKIVRVRDGALNYNNIVEAGGLSSAASSLMGMFMVGSESEIPVKNEEWTKEKFPPENANANLAPSGVKSATCKEEGDYYIVTITGKDEVNPKSGGPGVGSLCGVIQEETITGSISSVPGLTLSNIKIAYENVTTTAKIEKSTGNVVELKINAPCILQLSAKLAVISINDAKVGIQVYTDYTIAY